MKRIALAFSLLLLVVAGIAAAQDATATTVPSFGPILGTPLPTSTTDPNVTPSGFSVPPTATVAPITTAEAVSGSDPRAAVCNASTLPGFVPYIIRDGDRLADLLTGVDNLTVDQLSSINCLDDSSALIVGSTIWIPGASSAASDPEQTEVPTSAIAPAITGLLANEDSVTNLEGVSLTWQATGAAAYLYPCPTADESDDCPRPYNPKAVALTGSAALTNFQYAGTARYRLEVVGSGDPVTQDVTFDVTCSNPFIGPVSGNQRCPDDAPRAVFGVWQPFDGGVLMYFSDVAQIYVMTNADHRVHIYNDTFVDGMTETKIDAPKGKFTAERGFGLIWRKLDAQDGLLGWALAQETGFSTARQAAGRVSYTTLIQGPGATVYAVTLVPGDPVGYWTQVAG
jgi:hypothetical protein